MRLSEVVSWVDAHWLHIGGVLAALIAVWKAVPSATRLAIELRFPRLVNAIRMAYALGPDVVKFLAALRGVVTGTPKPPELVAVGSLLRRAAAAGPGDGATPPETPTAKRSRPPPLAVLLALALGPALAGCPKLQPPDGCTPHDQRCRAGVPEVCSPSQRWTPADRPCAEVSATCCATPSAYGGRAVYACVPADRCVAAADGGAP